MKCRDFRIDLLRTIGTMLTILAHADPPVFLLNIRTFDVVLLVMISAMCSHKTGNISTLHEYRVYLIKRIKRLIIPTYIMITCVIVVFYLGYSVILRRNFFWTYNQIRDSYLFLDSGIGYVWIVRIYILIAIFIPIIYRCYTEMKSQTFNVMVIMFGLLSCVLTLVYRRTIVDNAFLFNTVFYLPQYLFAASIGVLTYENVDKSKLYFFLFAFIFLVIQFGLYKKEGFCPSNYKYPPSFYYITYGVAVSVLLYYVTGYIRIKNSKLKSAIIWTSKNSFTVYLSHVPFIILLNSISVHVLTLHWAVKYLAMLLFAFFTTSMINSSLKIAKFKL